MNNAEEQNMRTQTFTSFLFFQSIDLYDVITYHLDMYKNPNGSKDFPARTCKDLHMSYPGLRSGKYIANLLQYVELSFATICLCCEATLCWVFTSGHSDCGSVRRPVTIYLGGLLLGTPLRSA